VADNGEPILVADAQHDPRLYKKADETSRFVTRNMICAPLKYKGDVIGVVQAINKIGSGTFRESEVSLFCGFASQAAIAIENVNLFNQRLNEEKARLEMRGILDTYVAPQVSETLINNPEKLMLGGSRQEVTVLFTDLVGFTSISEKLEPEEVVSHLNDYFSEMVEVIFQHNGTLDKFMGDAIMALYGVPIQQGYAAREAVLSAIEMQIALHEKRKVWRSENKHPLYMGCSIHTGPAVVGNIGSSRRKDYTVIGDSVNVASRLQHLTRTYGCGIIISEETRKHIGDEFAVRELDIISVKGRVKPLKIFSVEIPELYPAKIIP
jgi:adenylate cyclase